MNYRCPATVVRRAVRLVEHNAERFAKTIRARAGRQPGPIVLAADAGGRARFGWSGDGLRAVPVGTTARERSSPGRTVSSCRRSPSRSSGASHSGRRRSSSSLDSPHVDACFAEAAAVDPGSRPPRPPRSRAGCLGEPHPLIPRPIPTLPRRPTSPLPSSRGRPGSRRWTRWGGGRRSPVRLRPAVFRGRLADVRDRARDEGPRVRHVAVIGLDAGPLPERAVARGRAGSGAGSRGGAPARLRRVDAGPSLADARLRPGQPVAVPAGGVRSGRAGPHRGRRGLPRLRHGRPIRRLPSRCSPTARSSSDRLSATTCRFRPLAQRRPDDADPGTPAAR